MLSSKLSRWVLAPLPLLLAPLALAAPIAVDDSFTVNEDSVLTVSVSDLISADFNSSGGGGGGVTFDGDWDYLDEIENQNGNQDGYPTDSAARDWKSADFDITTSTVGSWSSGALPLQAGGVDGFPGAADQLGGIGDAPGGGNLVTTFLFRNQFTLTAAQVAETDWSVSLLVDDSCAIHINGIEVLRNRLPTGALTTQTFGDNNPDETQYESLPINVPNGLLVAGTNTIAIELHQATLTSSDAGIDIQLFGGGGATGGFAYVDDPFGTSLPNFADGQHEDTSGFNGTGGLRVQAGGDTPGAGASSGGWQRTFSLASATTVEVSLRYRLIADAGFEDDEFIMALAEIDGNRIGNANSGSLFRIVGNGNGGGDDDSGWRQETFSIPLSAGTHTLDLGLFVSKSTVASEAADVYFDDIIVSGGSSGSGGVLANDTGDATLSAVLLSQPTNGSVTMDPSGTFIYTPDTEFSGNDTFTYRANDNSGDSAAATVTISVTPVNDAPTGVARLFNMIEDQILSVAAGIGLLQGASDVDNSAAELVAVLESDVAGGTLVINPNGAFTYAPRSDFNGIDSFTYRVSDGTARSEPLGVTINVSAVDDPPNAVADSYTVDENGQLQASVAQSGGGETIPMIAAGSSWRYLDDGSDQGVGWISTNFDDSSWATGQAQLGYGDGDEATEIGFGPDENDKFATTYFRRVFAISNPDVVGVLSLRLIRDDAAAVYLNGTEIVRTNLAAEAAFDIRASTSTDNENDWRDFDVDPSLLQAGINFLAVEIHQHDPDSSDLSFDLSLEGTATVVRGVLANDNDPEGDALSAVVESQPANGSVVMNSDGTFTYTPAANFFGEDSFQYRVSGGGLSSVGTATVTVVPGPNDVPEAMADSYSVVEDQTLTVVAASGVLSNDSDPDGDTMEAQLVSNVSNGSLSLNASGAFTYVPAANFFGTDSFVYRAADPLGASAGTVVTITVIGVNDAPLANGDVFVVQPGQIFSGTVLANDSDPDGDPVTAELIGDVDNGTLQLNANGTFTYNPGGFVGSTIFYYELKDAALVSDQVPVSLIVNGRPTAVADGYSVMEDGALNVAEATGLLGNDSDPEGQGIAALLRADVSNGVLALSSNGSFTYTPDADFSGTDTFVYVVSDGFQTSTSTVVTISVQPVNDIPVAAADDYGVITNQALTVGVADGVLANDTDVDGDDLDAVLVTNVTNGSLSLSANGAFTYTPAANFEGDDSFTYRAEDGSSNSVATVTLHVGPDLKTIVINEIMYHPASDNDLEEYIEIANLGDNAVNLEGWSFTSGVGFTFPAVTLPAGGFLVVAADVASFNAAYGAAGNLVGGWTGRLSNSGERLRLRNGDGVEVDDLTYADQGEWAARERIDGARGWDWNSDHDGGGQSIELRLGTLSNKHGQNWAASAGGPTPGAANSVAATAIAPMILDVAHSPVVPKSNEPVRITARLLDEDGTNFSASLFWREAPRNPGSFSGMSMLDDGNSGDGEAGDGIYGATLPAMADGSVVEFYVFASDGGASRTWPASTNVGQVANAHYQVDDEVHEGHWPIYRIVMTGDEDNGFVNVNRSSNERFHATLVLDDCSGPVVRYNSSIRVRGAGSRSHNPPPMRVSVPHDNLWNQRSAMNWNTKYTYSQYIGMRLFQGAGMAAPDGKPMSVRWNGEDRMRDDAFDYGLAVHMEVLDGDFIDDKHPDDRDGNLYKKARPAREWAWRNGDVGDYLNDGWSKETNADENDWSDLDGWLDVMNNAPGAGDYVAQVEAVVDLDQWLEWFGAMAILANGETNASNGADDDFSIYRGVVNPRFQMVPHDLDTILGKGDGSRIDDPEHTIFDMISRGDVLDPLVPLFSDPGVQVRYYQALRELLQGSFEKSNFDELVDNSLADWVPQNRINEIKQFMDARRIYITGLVDAELGAAPPAPSATTSGTLVGTHGALMISEVLASNTQLNHFGTYPDFVEIYNSGASAVNLSGMGVTDDPAVPGKFIFPAGTNLAAGQFLILLGASDPLTEGLHLGFGIGANGDSIYLTNGGTTIDSVTFGLQIPDFSIGRTGLGLITWALGVPSPGSANGVQAIGDPNELRINEWLTQPELVFERDFVEIYNPSALPVALGGLAITDEPASDPTRFQLPALSFVASSGFGLFEAVGNNASAGNASELPFKLGSDQGWLAISGANGVRIDQVHYLCHRLDVSQGRATDGAADYADFVLPTPGFSNSTDLASEAAVIAGLRITEMMYHPAAGNLEYIELRNVSAALIELEGVELTDGVQFAFPQMTLQPGEFVLVVQDTGAFESAYGGGLNIAGSYSGKLSNGGEHLRLEIVSLGAGILDFDYSDAWYPSTDGDGFALEIVDGAAIPSSWGEKSSWRAGSVTGGTPGSTGGNPAAYDEWVVAEFGTPSVGVSGKLDDPDEDGIVNLLEFALGGDPLDGNLAELLQYSGEGGFLTLTYKRAVSSAGLVQLVPQISGDNRIWNSGGGLTVQELISSDGIFETWRVRDATPIGVGPRRFLRIHATCTDG